MYIVFAQVNITKFQSSLLLCTNGDTIDLLQDNNIKSKMAACNEHLTKLRSKGAFTCSAWCSCQFCAVLSWYWCTMLF